MIKYAKKDNFYSVFPMGEIPNDWEELTKEDYDKHFEKTLDELKSEKLSELTSITSKFDNQLVNTDMIIKSSLGFSINADLRSQLNIHRLINIGTEPVSFIVADNTTVDLSLAQLNILINECEENMQYLFDLKQSYKKQIADATTKEELDVIKIKFEMKDFSPFNTTQYAPFAYLHEVRMYTENDEQHMTLNKWISKSRTLARATMKSTNTERDDVFDLKMSTNSVYTTTDSYQIYRSWLDGGNHWITMPNQNYFSEYEFDCINLSKFSFCTAWDGTGRCGRSCEIVVYIDGEEKYSNIFNGLSPSKSHFSITLNKSGTEIKEVSVN